MSFRFGLQDSLPSSVRAAAISLASADPALGFACSRVSDVTKTHQCGHDPAPIIGLRPRFHAQPIRSWVCQHCEMGPNRKRNESNAVTGLIPAVSPSARFTLDDFAGPYSVFKSPTPC